MKNLRSIRLKILLWCLAATFVSLAVIEALSYLAMRRSLITEVTDKLRLVGELKYQRADNFMEERASDARVVQRTPVVSRTTTALGSIPVKELLAATNYVDLTKDVTSYFMNFVAAYEYEDVFLVNTNGDVVFTLNPRPELGLNLGQEPLQQTPLGEAFERCHRLLVPTVSRFRVHPMTDRPALFVVNPIVGENRFIVGYVVIEVGTERLYALANDFKGLGLTGEVLICAPEKDEVLLLAPLRNSAQLPMTPLVKLDPKSTAPVQQVVRGMNGLGLNRDFRGIDCISWWKPFPALHAGIVAKMDLSEALEPLRRETTNVLLTTLLAGFLAALAAFLAARAVAQPIQELTAGVQRIASGDWEHRVALATADEIGQLSRSFDDMMGKLRSQRNELASERQRLAQENEARKQAEERSRLILESTAEGIFGVDTEGRFTFVNGVAIRLLGFTTEEMIGQLSHALIHHHHADGREYLMQECPMFAAYKRGVTSRIDDEQLWRKDGTGFPVEYGATPLLKDGVIVGAVISFTDITERKLAEQRVRETEKFFRSVLELAPDGMMVVDAKGTIELANAQCEKLFQFTREELIGQKVEMLVPEAKRIAHAGLREVFHQEQKARGMGLNCELHAQRKDGSLFPVDIGLSPLPARNGDGAQVAISIRDISERKEQENALKQAKAKAEEATQMKSSFLANMSHEIRTPMNAVINMTQLALESELGAKPRQYLNVVSTSARGLLALINDILDFSKIEAGKIELESAHFRLRGLLDEITDSFRARVLEKRIEFVTQVDYDVPDEVIGDSLRVRQVLINLVGNAFKFTHQGEVVLRVSRTEPAGAAGAAANGQLGLRFSVKDSGIGIPKDKQDKLFASFTQVDASTSRKYGGTGLGLAISKKLVDLMGGDLKLASEEGKGTEFYFTLHLGCSAQQKRDEMAFPPGIRELAVLVVEDNRSSQEWMASMLRQLGFPFQVAGSAEEGLEILNRENNAKAGSRRFGLVLMDCFLPGMNGIEAGRRIRAQESTRDLPMVMISSFAGKEEDAQARAVGFRDVLAKPLTYSMLYDAIVEAYGFSNLSKTHEQHRATREFDSDEFKGIRVLVAEDNAANRMVAQALLEKAGMIPDFAENGCIALEKARGNDHAVILMDMQMPEMDGLEATRQIRKQLAHNPIPIIALTANAMKGDIDRCLEAGMNDFVSKPIDRVQLFQTIRKWLPKKTPATAAADSAAPAPEAAVAVQALSPSPSAPPASEIPDLPGLDVREPMAQLGFDWTTFKDLLLVFAEDLPNDRESLRKSLEAKDWPAAQRHAHTIKGASATYGALELSAKAGKLEKALKEQSGEYEALYAEVQKAAEKVMKSLQAVV